MAMLAIVCLFLLFKVCVSLPTEHQSSKEDCPLIWHVRDANGECVCGTSFNSHIKCDESYVYIKRGGCMTWNNSTREVEFHRCLYTALWHLNTTGYECTLPGFYRIPNTISGLELNREVCRSYNRKGLRCGECLSGFGPAVFSDGYTCADCSGYRNYWIFQLCFQLSMITFMYLIFIPLQINVASSPFNVMLAYIQIASVGLKLPIGVHAILRCYFGTTITNVLLTIAGFFNLEFFRMYFAPSCVSSSIRAVNVLLFDYIIAIYPLFLTVFFLVCISLHDSRNRLFMVVSYPLIKLFKRLPVHKSWNPKRTILKTFVTFFILSYTKTLIVSFYFLVAVQSYNKRGHPIPDSIVLIYDTTIGFFQKEHTPYACIAIFTLLIFIILPTLFIMLYPTHMCRSLLSFLPGLRSWNVINHLMDIFQGQYKDGTGGSTDYRHLAATSLLLRIMLGCEVIILSALKHKEALGLAAWLVPGMAQIFVGTLYFITKPYKKPWLSHFDGSVFTVVGITFIMVIYGKTSIYIATGGLGLTVTIMMMFFIYAVYKCIRECIRAHA